MADQEFLASFGVEIDESGVERLQAALARNRELAEELAAAFEHARQAVQAFFRELSETAMPDLSGIISSGGEAAPGMRLALALDLTNADKALRAFVKEAARPLKLAADASAVVSAGQAALHSLQSMFASSLLTLRGQVVFASSALPAAAGGLSKALSSVLNVSSVTASGAVSSSRSVQAPVNIHVAAAGSDPAAVGRSVYDVTEQYLLRTLQSAL